MLAQMWKQLNGNPVASSDDYEEMKNTPVMDAIERRQRWIIMSLKLLEDVLKASESLKGSGGLGFE
jgi:hypothetical protein